jgi:uncharacterized protein (DUF952 family)
VRHNPAVDVWRFADPAWAELELGGFAVEAVNGPVGTVREAARDRIVVATADGRSIVLPAGVVESVDMEARRIDVYRSTREIDAAPEDDDAIGRHYAPWGAGGRVLPVERARQLLVHIAERDEWTRGLDSGAYRPASLDEVGFVHASTAYSLLLPANLFYRGRRDLVVLCIDQSLLGAELRWEEPEPTVEAFPHVYGPVNPDAVVAVFDFPPREDGTFEVPPAARKLADGYAARG